MSRKKLHFEVERIKADLRKIAKKEHWDDDILRHCIRECEAYGVGLDLADARKAKVKKHDDARTLLSRSDGNQRCRKATHEAA